MRRDLGLTSGGFEVQFTAEAASYTGIPATEVSNFSYLIGIGVPVTSLIILFCIAQCTRRGDTLQTSASRKLAGTKWLNVQYILSLAMFILWVQSNSILQCIYSDIYNQVIYIVQVI